MSAATPRQTIAVFGATGGCMLNFTISALQHGHQVQALVRTPSKLTNLLKEQKMTDYLLSNLNIIQGNSKDEANVTEALKINGQVADIVVTGVGATPTLKYGVVPVMEETVLCQTTAACILKGLTTIRAGSPSTYKSPPLIAISSTGISEHGRDIPAAMVPLYKVGLKVPHEDKKAMERIITAEGSKESSVISGWVMVRPAFLWGEKGKGWENLTVGIDEEGEGMPKGKRGYIVTRVDVGQWMYGALIQQNGANGKYHNKCVALTQDHHKDNEA